MRRLTQILVEIKKISLLLFFSCTVALIINHLSPVGIELIGKWDQVDSVINDNKKNGSFDRLPDIDDIGLAKLIYDSGNAIFVDARPMDSFSKGHVKGAMPLPIEEFDNMIDSFSSLYPTDKHIITYCSGRHSDDSQHLAQMFLDFGYKTVSIMADGFPVWEENGFPID